ncbi:hypothetical protein GTA62_18540 [Roseobacter sp. HKCCD9010]|uniref:hypothetical protein n=1 Tax=unclassified Roseobacter TaxID=196798 RepID=UPI001490EF3D|nr:MULTISPECIES: hypothetical protein [unclassified Roseobacter]MBF9051918.1 hypothetical protein [Rhodobacterales bacterium HKCCD4356]NNV13911.1 hypothetical protein [Roseobacter sp. HKCCD7357]NNV18083.1 hypothetical protein [Roseobacter sp. HKCCD8768]NNV27543.1 hypothetical protein [Roseobacter sp. HKCCD8192]NNV31809.1 hypothetical protein [Roseobacter sp. HKCCD9061]
MISDPKSAPRTAAIVSPFAGRLIGGLRARAHDNGDVSILFGGLEKRGKPLSPQELQRIEDKRGQTNAHR